MRHSFEQVAELRQQHKTNLRLAANMLAIKRVVEATMVRGLYP